MKEEIVVKKIKREKVVERSQDLDLRRGRKRKKEFLLYLLLLLRMLLRMVVVMAMDRKMLTQQMFR